MKKVEDLKKKVIIDEGYGHGPDMLSPYAYEMLNNDRKSLYTLNNEDGNYYKSEEIPNISNEELMLIMAETNYRNIKTIKNCVVFFTVITIISLVLSFVTSCSIAA